MSAKTSSITTPLPEIPQPSEGSSVKSDIRPFTHAVLANKGGVGKTLVSFNLLQFLRDHGREVQAFDLDPMNFTLAGFEGLKVRTVRIFTREYGEMNADALDTLAISILTDREDFVLDNGAGGFMHFSQYITENDIPRLMAERGRTFLIHTVLPGGEMLPQCLLGLDTLMKGYDASVKIVIWLNEHFGPVEYDGTAFEDMAIYRDNTDRIAGLVRLPKLPPMFLRDFEAMMHKRLGYQAAIDSPQFHILNKSRLFNIRRRVWEQLDAVF